MSYKNIFRPHEDLESVWMTFYTVLPENELRRTVLLLLEDNGVPFTQETVAFLKQNWRFMSTNPGKVLEALKPAD